MIRAPPIVAMRPRKKSVESFLAAMNDANSIGAGSSLFANEASTRSLTPANLLLRRAVHARDRVRGRHEEAQVVDDVQ